MNNIELKDSYWASVSGGKDSLYMFRLILDNTDRYPLNGVVHFKLEIDYPWVGDVCKLYKEWCSKLGIPYIEIQPRKTYDELFNKYGFPTRQGRWCNSAYKLDCRKQFENQFKGIVNIKWYIGICADETNRIKDDIYPLVENDICEEKILAWAQSVSVFNNYYNNCKRQGCMFCPNSSMIEKAYLKKYYPDIYKVMYDMIQHSEHARGYQVYHKPIEEIDKTIDNKWLERVK